jgi:uncharacterized protein
MPTKKVKTNTSTKKPPAGKQPKLDMDQARFIQNSSLVARSMLAGRLGTQFNGDRDLYAAFGYLVNPQYMDYRALYDRQGMASRIVDIFPDDTWKKPPVLVDGDGRSDALGEKDTPFLKEWTELAKKLGIYQIFRQADIMAGIGRYAIIVLGAPGEYNQPITGQVASLFFAAAYDEGQASITEWNQENSDKFGLPKTYTITFDATDGGALQPIPNASTVDQSRVIHISENRLGSRTFGRPRMQTILNRLFDLEKVTGGAAEATWLAVYKGLALKARDNFDLPAAGSEAEQAMNDEIENYIHGFQRVLRLSGMDVEQLGVDTVNAELTYGMIIDDIAGSKGIPKRILLGSERGELASSQDQASWAGVIESRQRNYAEPEILRPFIDWCIDHGVISKPSKGTYDVEWQPLFTTSLKEDADTALVMAQGASAVTGGIPEQAMKVDEWRDKVRLPPMPEEDLKDPNQDNGADLPPTDPAMADQMNQQPKPKQDLNTVVQSFLQKISGKGQQAGQ